LDPPNYHARNAPPATRHPPRIIRRLARWRAWVQAAFLLTWLEPLGLRLHWICSPVFHCYSCPWATFACPIGVIANFSALQLIPYLAIGTLLAVGVVFGTFVCGWACPFGFLQDLAARVPTPKVKLPSWMGYCRYAVLVGLVLAVPYFFGEKHPLFFCSVCPAGALEGAVPNVAAQISSGAETISWPSTAKIVILAVFVVVIFFTWRPWCTLLCPLGAIFSLCNRVSFLFIRFRADRCNDCELCRDLCKYRGPSERRGGDLRCIRCLDCVRCRAISVGTAFDRPDGPELVQIAPPRPPTQPQ
jgi:ferredoxin-type protein NapH